MLARLGTIGLRSICALCVTSFLLTGCAGNGRTFIEYESTDDGAACAWKTVGNVGLGTMYFLMVAAVVPIFAVLLYVYANAEPLPEEKAP